MRIVAHSPHLCVVTYLFYLRVSDMDAFWEEVVIATVPLISTLPIRVLNSECRAMCASRITVQQLYSLILYFRKWKECTWRRPVVNSWRKSRARCSEDRPILIF